MSSIKIKNSYIEKLEIKDFLPLICAAAALRKEKHLNALLEKSKLHGIKEKPLYESLLQNYLFTGYPSAMIALKILKEYYPKLENGLHDSWDLNKYKERGTKNCKKIYGRKFDKLILNVKSFSPELSDWLLLEGYGKVMGRKGLSLKQRELNNVSVLTALKFEDQLYSHINGAFRTKSSKEQIERVIDNLDFLGDEELSKFGMKVLKIYLHQKRLI
ncbi:MAG: carboxymuconolactone decarboxylase family protein [Ignavibacteriaceae bacterium]